MRFPFAIADVTTTPPIAPKLDRTTFGFKFIKSLEKCKEPDNSVLWCWLLVRGFRDHCHTSIKPNNHYCHWFEKQVGFMSLLFSEFLTRNNNDLSAFQMLTPAITGIKKQSAAQLFDVRVNGIVSHVIHWQYD